MSKKVGWVGSVVCFVDGFGGVVHGFGAGSGEHGVKGWSRVVELRLELVLGKQVLEFCVVKV